MEQKTHVLIVDKDQTIRDSLGMYLEAHGCRASLDTTPVNALHSVAVLQPDCIILEAIGGGNGFSAFKDIQKITDAPIIFISSETDETERVIGLEMGADDYLVKPFNARELLARIRAVLRRYKKGIEGHSVAATYKFGPWQLQCSNQELHSVNGTVLSLSTGEVRLLKIFLDHPNVVMSRDKLLELTHGRHAHAFDRSIDNYVSRIRKKIEKDPQKPRYLKTYWGGGYAIHPQEPDPI